MRFLIRPGRPRAVGQDRDNAAPSPDFPCAPLRDLDPPPRAAQRLEGQLAA